MKQTWCIPRLDSHFLARMEELLWLYAQDYDARYPVVCFDERPCFLIGDVVSPLPVEEGQVKREYYLYSKHGSCCLLATIEPLTAKRVFRMEARRTGISPGTQDSSGSG